MAATAMLARPFPLFAGISTLTARRLLSPRMARFTLHAPAFAELGVEEPGEIITLGWCDAGEELVLPQLGWRFPPGRPEQHWRNFTVRAYRPDAAEIDVDFSLHGHVGRASTWAIRAEPGDTVGYAGPRLHWQPASDVDWSVLAADETGLPALLAILETLPPGHRAIGLAEIHDDAERQGCSSDAEVDLRWLSRDGREPGTTTVLADAAAALELPAGRSGVGWWRGAGDARRPRRAAHGRPPAGGDGRDGLLEAPPDAGRRRILNGCR
jgi:NADPH-dependent ferric siderophore reductase